MKTKIHLLILLLAFLGVSVQAQEGEIIYTDLEPDSCHVFSEYVGSYQFPFDIDGNGTSDITFYTYVGYWGGWWLHMGVLDNWEYAIEDPAFLWPEPPQIDTLQHWHTTPSHTNPYLSMIGWSVIKKYGLRKKVGNDYFYAWLKIDGGATKEVVDICVEEFAYCTTPNYPLRWGQTSLTGIEGNESIAFATIHPNPTTGLVTIVGKDLNQAEVVNMLGQCVATVQGKGENLQIDISKQPAGIYFVRITDDEGRKCTHKVVKE